jgi:Methylmalonic aciduria and homocystinuria type D protein
MVMQWSVHSPSPFICKHRDRLLPEWVGQISSVLVVLQRANCGLTDRNGLTETQKQNLRDRFLEWGSAIAAQLHRQGYRADLFDPKTGYPLWSQAGTLGLDDVAVVRACLGYSITQAHGCCLILHPEWGNAVYPSVLVSSADPKILKSMLSDSADSGEEF